MAARDSRRDCRSGSSLSLQERDLGVRVQSLLNPDAGVEDIPTLTPALSRRERVVYPGCFRLMPMPGAPPLGLPALSDVPPLPIVPSLLRVPPKAAAPSWSTSPDRKS